MAVALGLLTFAGGSLLVDFMTTSEPVRAYARDMLPLAALATLIALTLSFP